MFKKTVVVDNTGMNGWAKARLRELSEMAVFYDDFPADPEVIRERIGDADCLMVSYCTPITREILEKCPNLTYVGMCCTLYNEASANVDIPYCRERNIEVTGITDYGDGGVIEFGLASLVWLLHGFGKQQWRERPNELYCQKIGVVGMGNTGFKLAKILKLMGAEVYYSDLRRNEAAETLGIRYLPLDELLQTVDILSTQLPKNTCLIREREFELFGQGKIFLNTSIGPTFDVEAMERWLSKPGNYYVCEEVGVGDTAERFKRFDNFIYIDKCAGSSEQCTLRLSQKSIENVEHFLKKRGADHE
ncbi:MULTISPECIES: NAD(P)-dependent oxidoreductase [Enterocloster]|uniref:Lactate dehydrogenase n=1 Tax=Enterocloster lavalensis TaxID=460384 RepID=A0A1I0CL96_9FIRM|nr:MULTISPECIES: NAD(P)-dependent oxidoreductase [Enterocloster]MDR3755915.1 NAD(P)-dependent oxidoreductase [Enterocloster sp.]SET20391.1 Lactate dehydrogenase [Enterocloster lavalensis]